MTRLSPESSGKRSRVGTATPWARRLWRRRPRVAVAAALLLLACSESSPSDPTPNPPVGPASALAVLNPPAGAQAGTPFTVAVALKDASGHTVSAYGDVTLALAINPSGATLAGPTTVTAVEGVATFDGLAIDRVGDGYMLTASVEGLTSAITPLFDVVAGPVARVTTNRGAAALTFPTGTATVQLAAWQYDAAGNATTTSVTWLTDDPTVASVTSSGLVTARSAGLATVSAVAGGKASTVLIGVLCAPTRCSPQGQLTFSEEARDGSVGETLPPLEAALTLGSCEELTVTIAIGHNPSGANLTGETTKVTTESGAPVIWSDLRIDTPGGGFTLVAFASCGSTLIAQKSTAAFDIEP